MNVPEPRSISPSLFKFRDMVFNWLSKPYRELWAGLSLVEPAPFSAKVLTEAPSSDGRWWHEVHLTAHRAIGPAPYTDQYYHYEWNFATGPNGYWAASEAKPKDRYGEDLREPW